MMTEYKVWRSIVDYGLSQGWELLGACPPGGSVYVCNRCCLIDPETGKRDEPDILFKNGTTLIAVERKPRLSGLISTSKNSLNETDAEKLLRIAANFNTGIYNKQLSENYGIIEPVTLQIALGYSKGIRDNHFSISESFHHFIVTNNTVEYKN